jgi:hypothetical protein
MAGKKAISDAVRTEVEARVAQFNREVGQEPPSVLLGPVQGQERLFGSG